MIGICVFLSFLSFLAFAMLPLPYASRVSPHTTIRYPLEGIIQLDILLV
jgi:hypothetical protein